MKIVNIEAVTLSDSWFQLVYNALEYGRDFKIDQGSFAGHTRKEFDFIVANIKRPYERTTEGLPLIPEIPESCNIPAPTDKDYLVQYIPYIMGALTPEVLGEGVEWEPKKNESYTYGQRMTEEPVEDSLYRAFMEDIGHLIFKDHRGVPQLEDIVFDAEKILNQVELICWTYKNQGHRNNQLVIQIAKPTDLMLLDPPCLRHIDTRIQDNRLHFFPYFRSWDLWCIDEKSEILTYDGWKNIDTISKYDLVASFNGREIIYEDIIKINKQQYVGEMYRLKTKRIDQLITANHRILHKYITHSGSKRIVEKYQYSEAKNLIPKDGSFIPLSAPFDNLTVSTFEDIEKAKLIGWILTDAGYRKGCNTIEIYQSEKKYTDEIRNILNNLSIEFTERGNIDKTFTLLARKNDLTWIKEIIPNREPTSELLYLPIKEREALFDAMIKADGSFKIGRNGTISMAYYSIKKERLEWFQLLAFSLGYSTIINGKKGVIQISNKKESMIQRSHFDGNKLPIEKYNGMVWCVATRQGNFVMKRNGLISITGNSGYPANLAGISVLQEYMSGQIGVEQGEMVCTSKGLHLYDYSVDFAKMRCMF